MRFTREDFTREIFEESYPLLRAHYKEIAHYQDIPLEPNFDAYQALQNDGRLRCYFVRNDEGVMLGYAAFFIAINIHYISLKQALLDVIFIDEKSRGIGKEFIPWCDAQLKEEGVRAVFYHIKERHNFGPFLETLGYELMDLIYARRLDRDASEEITEDA